MFGVLHNVVVSSSPFKVGSAEGPSNLFLHKFSGDDLESQYIDHNNEESLELTGYCKRLKSKLGFIIRPVDETKSWLLIADMEK